jgi:hypothetical protein
MNVMNNATQMAGMLIGEPSFADAMAAIEKAEDLSLTQKRHWLTSLRQMARYLDRPASLIPTRIAAVAEAQDLRQSPSQCEGGAPLVQPTAA